MRIQVLNPANSYKPVPHEAVENFIQRGNAKDGIVLKVTPAEDYNLGIVHDDTGALNFSDKAGLYSIGVSTHSDYYGLTWFAINENKKGSTSK